MKLIRPWKGAIPITQPSSVPRIITYITILPVVRNVNVQFKREKIEFSECKKNLMLQIKTKMFEEFLN